jgi:N-carbamoyl-L-amino-acid hydrolase
MTTYLELHIEQGQVADLDLPLGAVRNLWRQRTLSFFMDKPHSGSTPMNRRGLFSRGEMSPEIYRITARGGVCTMAPAPKPGIVTSVVEECRITLDQRHLDAALAAMLREAQEASDRFAQEGNVLYRGSGTGDRAGTFHDELVNLVTKRSARLWPIASLAFRSLHAAESRAPACRP